MSWRMCCGQTPSSRWGLSLLCERRVVVLRLLVLQTLLQGESGLANVKKGDFVQLQRRGFCRCDVPYDAKKGQNLVGGTLTRTQVAG